MANLNHYDVLKIESDATQADIKRAYRRLAKQFHPDSNHGVQSHEHIAHINAAYEVLRDPAQRKNYDDFLQGSTSFKSRSSRTAQSQHRQDYQKRRSSGKDIDESIQKWLKFVYHPVCQSLSRILSAFDQEVENLSADPFDDGLMEAFQTYIEVSRDHLQRAQTSFQTLPNPSMLAKPASSLYFCLSQVGDGLDELERFTTSYDDHYLHTGHELFRIAVGLKQEAQFSLSQVMCE